jgi:hypothetical protein
MRGLAAAICLSCAATTLSAQHAGELSLQAVLERVGERVEGYFARAQSLVCREIVRMLPLTSTWSSEGLGRTTESELRLSWAPGDDGTPARDAHVLRHLLRVNGRAPRRDDHNNCTEPEQEKEERQPLSMLLPANRGEYAFQRAGHTRLDGRAAVTIDYTMLKKVTVESQTIGGRDDCVSFTIEGGRRGRLWIDTETYDVLRLDEWLSGIVDVPLPPASRRLFGSPTHWTVERLDTSIRFKAFTFTNPDETLVLPASVSALRIVRGAGTPRRRTLTEYTNYQRFLTGGRIVPPQ